LPTKQHEKTCPRITRIYAKKNGFHLQRTQSGKRRTDRPRNRQKKRKSLPAITRIYAKTNGFTRKDAKRQRKLIAHEIDKRNEKVCPRMARIFAKKEKTLIARELRERTRIEEKTLPTK
jgi:hypothetical protein